MSLDHYCIDLTDGTRLHVDSTAGPLSGLDAYGDPMVLALERTTIVDALTGEVIA